MKKRTLTKIFGMINAIVFLALGVVTFFFGVVTALIPGMIEGIGIYTNDFILANFEFYYKLIPLDPNYAVAIVFGVIAILSFIMFLSSKGMIKKANREIVGFHKKRKSSSLYVFNLFVFAGILATGFMIKNNIFKITSLVIAGFLVLSTIAFIIDKIKARKEYKGLKADLEKAEESNILGQKVNTAPTISLGEKKNIEISNDRGQMIINEIARLDKLKTEGVISNVEYTRMREQAVKKLAKK